MPPFAVILAQRTTRLPNGCLRWDGGLNNGYPSRQVHVEGVSRTRMVRREVWEIHRGTLSIADRVRPTCGNVRCVELAHLTTDHKALADRVRDNATVLPNGCIRWDGALHPQRDHIPMIGVTVAKKRLSGRPLRRLLWIEAGREINPRDVVRPTCSEPLCVRLDHLARVTRAEMSAEYNASTGRCRSGRHDLTVEANVRRDRRGKRQGCVPCLRERQRAYSIAERDDGRLSARKRHQTVPDGDS